MSTPRRKPTRGQVCRLRFILMIDLIEQVARRLDRHYRCTPSRKRLMREVAQPDLPEIDFEFGAYSGLSVSIEQRETLSTEVIKPNVIRHVQELKSFYVIYKTAPTGPDGEDERHELAAYPTDTGVQDTVEFLFKQEFHDRLIEAMTVRDEFDDDGDGE